MVRRQRMSRLDLKLSPYLYISPFFILFALVGLFPLVYTGYLSLHDWDRLYYQRGEFVGLENYRFVLSDPVFIKSLVNTFSIFLMSSVPQVIVAVAVAALLDSRLRGSTFWRMSVLLPFVVAPAAAVLIFGSLFADQYGVINGILEWLGLEPVRWHVDRWWSHFAIAGMVNWRWTGYNALIFLAAMQAVPRDLYAAAALDGASNFQQFRKITVPAIRPTIVFTVIVATIAGMQVLAEPLLFGGGSITGGSDRQFQTLSLYLYEVGFSRWEFGYASAASWATFALILLAAVVAYLLVSRLRRR
jgi:cellobiose transport system permease protein